jgi:peptidoglycan/xylan/chitin deacetylase (PgdA/CDA1 family)
MLPGVRERCFILIFHGVGEDPRRGEERVWVSRTSLRSVLDGVAERSDMRVTFDDGNRSDYDHALPELVRRGLHATFFVVADRIGKPGYLSAEMLQELLDAGMDIQSHGMHHVQWRGLDSAPLREELYAARELLEQAIGRRIDDVAIPWCLYDRRVLRLVRAAGYRHVYTCDRGSADPRAWLQARNQISCGDDAAKLAEITSPSLATRVELALKAPIKRWR